MRPLELARSRSRHGPHKIRDSPPIPLKRALHNVPFGVTYEKIGTIQRRLAWPLHKDDTLSRSGRPTGLNIYCSFFCLAYRDIQRRVELAGESPV
ncbi:hypothetical protein K474DRAFT_1737375 [Panus rudis PR-1116 ss-1]|nr:hypothetical protein K474DRAFT_1737375 [Panus rudis PR-1116 ss-1]